MEIKNNQIRINLNKMAQRWELMVYYKETSKIHMTQVN